MFGFVSKKAYQSAIDLGNEALASNVAVIARIQAENIDLCTRLAKIAAMETPSCAHIGRKMAAVARGEV